MTEREKMLSGVLYDPADAELIRLRERADKLCTDFNRLYVSDEQAREALLRDLVAHLGKGAYLRGPVFFDYGCFTSIGENTFANFHFTCLDCCPVYIGANVFIGPNVSLLTPIHPLRWQERNVYARPDGVLTDREYAKPITIADHCWISGGVTVCGGVTIGTGSVIGAGSVVTRDIPPGVIAAGVPCRVIRPITEEDSLLRDGQWIVR